MRNPRIWTIGLFIMFACGSPVVAGSEEQALRVRLSTTTLSHFRVRELAPKQAFESWKRAVEAASDASLNLVVLEGGKNASERPVSLELREVSATDCLKFLSNMTGAAVRLKKNVVLVELP